MKKIHISRPLLTAGAVWGVLGTFAWITPFNTYHLIIQCSGLALLLNGLFLVAISYTGTGISGEKKWVRAEGIVDLLFSSLLLIDPVLSFFAFPFIISPWMISKGLLKMLASLTLAKNISGWSGDFIAGALLIVFGLFVPHDPMERPLGVTLLMGIIGWTIGLLYLYDALRLRTSRHHEHIAA